MSILPDLRRMIGRRRQARLTPDIPLETNGVALHDPIDLGRVEPKLSVSAHERDEARAELLGLVQRVGEQFESQTEQTERLVSLMRQLPDALHPLPEINRENTRLLDVLTDHLGQVRNREDALDSALMRLSEIAEQQNRSLGRVEEQLDASSRMMSQMTDALGGFRETLSELGRASDQTVSVLSDISRAIGARELRIQATLARSQRWMIGSVICCVLMGAAALAIALVAVL